LYKSQDLITCDCVPIAFQVKTATLKYFFRVFKLNSSYLFFIMIKLHNIIEELGVVSVMSPVGVGDNRHIPQLEHLFGQL